MQMQWRQLVSVVALASGAGFVQPAAAQTAPQERVAAIKQSFQESMAALRQYEWVETTIVSVKGEEKSRTQQRCLLRCRWKDSEDRPDPASRAARLRRWSSTWWSPEETHRRAQDRGDHRVHAAGGADGPLISATGPGPHSTIQGRRKGHHATDRRRARTDRHRRLHAAWGCVDG